MKKIIIILLIIFILTLVVAQTKANVSFEQPADTLHNSIGLIVGFQFYDENKSDLSFIFGTSLQLYRNNVVTIPLEFLFHYIPKENHTNKIFFPRITLNLKYNILQMGKTQLYLQGGIGFPVLFSYLLDFSPALGISYENIHMDIRNIFYVDTDGLTKIEANRLPITVVIFGVSI